MLTVFIPTFNRGPRLAANLELVINEISNFGLQEKVSILVSDNASEDGTALVCERASQTASDLNIKFTYFRNPINLGIGGNVDVGYRMVTSGWVMLLSDDDELYLGALDKICSDLEDIEPDVALYNFNQPPFDRSNPLIQEAVLYEGQKDYSHLESLIKWPKFTGVVVRSRRPEESDEYIHRVLSTAKHFPHIILSIFRYETGDKLYKSNFFAAGPDPDFLEHVNFFWYVSESLVKELEDFRSILGIENESLNAQISQFPRVNVLESSVTHLIYYYAGNARITRSVKGALWSNIIRYLTFRGTSKDGFALKSHSLKFFAKLVLLTFVFPASFVALPVLGRKRKLMAEGF